MTRNVLRCYAARGSRFAKNAARRVGTARARLPRMHQATRTEILAIIETYEGLLAQCNNAEGADAILVGLGKWRAALAALEAA